MNPNYRETAARLALRGISRVGGQFPFRKKPSGSASPYWSPSSAAAIQSSEDRLLERSLLSARLAGAVSVFISLAVLTGWFLNISFLKNVLPGAQTMKVNTALGLMFAGLALCVEGSDRLTIVGRRVALACAGTVALVGALTCVEYATGRNLHIDELLVRDSNVTVAVNPPGRMAFTTALSFLFLGFALLFSKRPRSVLIGQFLASAVAAVSLLSLVSYLDGIQYYHGSRFYAGVAVHTSLSLFVLSLGVLCSTANQGWMATLTSGCLGGRMARRILPLTLIPVALGWLQWEGQVRGFYNAADGVAVITSARVAILVLLVWVQSRLLNRLDQERTESYQELKASEANFRQLADSMPQMVWTTRADGWLDYCNRQWTDYTGLTAIQTAGWGSIAVIHPDDVASVINAWDRAVETGNVSSVEFRLKRASDGAYRWHLGRGVPIRDGTGRIIKWFGTSTDIDEHKRAQQALEEARQQLEVRVQERTCELERSNTLLTAILDSMGDGVICVNDKYEHVLFNRAARELLSSGPGQACPGERAQAFGIYYPDKQTLFKMEDLPLGRALRGENCDNIEIFSLPPGQKESAWLSANSRPVKDLSGRLHGAVLVLRDITARKQAEEAQARLLAILEETTDFVGTLRPDGAIFYANRALRGLRGVPDRASIERMTFEGIYPAWVAQQGALKQIMETAMQYGSWRGESVLCYHTGEEIPVSQLIMSHRNPTGEVEFLSTIARDISEMKDSEATLQLVQKELEASLVKERELSRSDPLTGLPNRRAFMEFAEIEKERSRRYSHSFGLAYLDLDGFKKINDTLGHAAGDMVLVTVAKVLRSNLRASDMVARLGGDEFAILLPETDPVAAKKVMSKLQELLRSAMRAGGWKVDFSIGLASFLDAPESVDYIIRLADELMYSVKSSGKGALVAAIMG
jgi:diguanylate cyclase (GGDEF)-like protein/PAS domain S-box-containing protein